MNTPDDNRRTMLNFLGYGEPRGSFRPDGTPGSIWFVGIEEASKIEDPATIPEKYGQEFHTCEYHPNDARTRVHPVMAKIVSALRAGGTTNPPLGYWRKERERLFLKGNGVCQLNLHPFPKKRAKEKVEDLSEIYGLMNLEEPPYKAELRARWKKIREKREEFNPLATICFGNCCWDLFAECFALEGERHDEQLPFRIYKESKVIMTPFFRPGRPDILMADQTILAVVEILKSAPFFL